MNQKLFPMIIIFNLMNLSQAIAGENPSEPDFHQSIDLSISLVKTKSFLCSRTGRELRGSGILFQQDGVTYVLTSEHVLYHENGKFCHQVSNASIGSLKTTFVAADFATGIGLLKLDTPLPDHIPLSSLPTINQFANHLPLESDPVVLAGFPSASETPLIKNLGTVLDVQSQRHWIPLLPEGIEIANTYGESGMSGGVYLNQSRHQIIGLISHLFYQLIPGEEKEVKEYADAMPVENHVFVIPSPLLITWIQKTLRNPNDFKPTVRIDSMSRARGRDKILLEGLAFEMKPSLTGTPAIAYGGDGVGIGGSSGGTRVQCVESKKVKVTLDQAGNSEALSFSLKSEILRRLKLKLFQQGGSLEIEFFVRNQDGNELISFRGLAEFFHYFLSPKYIPVLQIKTPHEKVKLFTELSEKLSRIVNSMNDDSVGFQETKNLLKEIHQICSLLESEHATRVSRSDLRQLKNYPGAWDWIFSGALDYDSTRIAMDLLKLLGELESLL